MATLPLILALLAGPARAEAPPVDPPARDLAETTRSIESIARQVRDLPPERRASAAEALRFLSVSCPYTRSALQIAFTLHAVVRTVPPEKVGSRDSHIRDDWADLQHGLATHVAVLEALGVDLPLPRPTDPLAVPGLILVDRTRLDSHADPIGTTRSLVRAVPATLARIDTATMLEIERQSAAVEEATGVVRPCPRGPWAPLPGQPWTLGLELGGWHHTLVRIAPAIDDPAIRADVYEMIALLDTYAAVSAP
ncbi:MAG: hypothetical protein R3F61_02050 [Myxococcota bacterium]